MYVCMCVCIYAYTECTYVQNVRTYVLMYVYTEYRTTIAQMHTSTHLQQNYGQVQIKFLVIALRGIRKKQANHRV